jgi:acylphosphatase
MTDIAKHILFSGGVQGVGFRFTALNSARRCGLTGFVRNTHDGSVELLVQGSEDDITDCLEDLHQTFHVRDTQIEQVPFDPSYVDFQITY